MKKLSSLFILFLAATSVSAQYKNDNVLYRTVFPEDLCRELQVNKDYLLLDVRSPGEYSDTSSSPLYNYGHLQNAVNIDVSEIGKRYPEIAAYKNKPVYVYCSHSQRSRRASKMLADSGFTNVINVNGGITAVRRLPNDNCLNHFLATTVGYKIISAEALCNKVSTGTKKIFLLDVRTDSAFKHISLREDVNGIGTFRNSINIPLADLKKRITEVPKDKEIVILDLFGDDAAKAAVILHENKYADVSMLLEGVSRMFYSDSRNLSCLKNAYISPVKYNIMSTLDLKRFAENNKDYLTLDVRTTEEFSNKHKDYWKNIGHMINAVNIPVNELKDKIAVIESYKNKPVIIYTFSGSREGHEAAALLIKNGFTNVQLLSGGLFNVRWTANNVAGNTSLAKLVTDVPEENL